MKWFKKVTSIEKLRKEYRKLLKMYHPDNPNGNDELTKQIMTEYDLAFSILSEEEYTDEQSSTYDKNEENEAFKEVLSKIIHINADVEIVGNWLWVEKGAYEYRKLLKEVGFHYAPRKKAWYWHADQYCRRSKREISLDEIRKKYGSEKVNRKTTKQYVLN